MNCPCGAGQLASFGGEGRIISRCPACRGMWLTRDGVTRVAERCDVGSNRVYGQLEDRSTGTSHRACVEGCGPLARSNQGGLELDWCRTCGGLWLDEGEFRRLTKEWSEVDRSGSSERLARDIRAFMETLDHFMARIGL